MSETLKYILVIAGIMVIVAAIFLMVVGFKVVSSVLGFVVSGVALITAIGFIIYFIRRLND